MKKIMKINLMVSAGLLMLLGIWLLFKSANTEIGHIEPVGHYCYPVSVHKTLLLKNGDVFIYGVYKDEFVAQLYHSNSRTFECLPKPPVKISEVGFNLAILASGDVLISGGEIDLWPNDKKKSVFAEPSAVALAQVYHYKTKTFEHVSDMTVPRTGHGSVLLPDGKLLIMGGWGFHEYAPLKINKIKELIYKSAELYDEKTKKFTALSSKMSKGMITSGTLLSPNKVLILETGALELFNPKHLSFVPLSREPQQKIGSDFYRLDDYSAVTFPKSDYIGIPPQNYNVSNGKFTSIPIRMPNDLMYGTTCRLTHNQFLFTGGIGHFGMSHYYSNATYLVNIKNRIVKQGPKVPFMLHTSEATALNNRYVLITPEYNPRFPAQQPYLLILNKEEFDNRF